MSTAQASAHTEGLASSAARALRFRSWQLAAQLVVWPALIAIGLCVSVVAARASIEDLVRLAAVEQLRDGRFDLVLSDRAMPGMNGDELALAIKEATPELPVVLVTGFGDLMNAEGHRPPGVDAVLAKPLTLATLRRTIAKMVQAG